MRSKTFSFKKVLIKNNLRHSWPLWVCSTLPLVLWQITVITAARTGYRQGGMYSLVDLGAEVRSLWADLATVAPYFNLVYGCMTAVVLLQNLYASRSVIGIHALPVTREQNWLGWVVSGFALGVIPLGVTLVVGILGWAGLPGLTFGSLPLILTYVVWMVCAFAWGFGFALFCGMFVGQLWALPVFTFILNFLGFGLQAILEIFQGAVLYGYRGGSIMDKGIYFSPFVLVISQLNREWRSGLVLLSGTPWILLLGALGLVFMGLALVAYRLRPLERAGELVVFRPFHTVFRIGFSVCFALCGGLAAGTMSNRVGWEILVYILLFGGLGMVLAQIALKKNYHFLSRRLLAEYLLTFGVVSALFSFGLCGGFGFNHWVPAPEQVESIVFQNVSTMYAGSDDISNVQVSVEDEETIEKIIRWHEAYLEKYPTQEAADRSGEDSYGDSKEEQAAAWGVTHNSAHIIVSYHLKNGTNHVRAYYFTVSRKAAETEGTMEWQLAQLWATLITPESFIKNNAETWEIQAYIDEADLFYSRGKANTLTIVDALVRDMALRHEKLSLFCDDDELTEPSVYMSLYGSGYQQFDLTETRYPNTLRALKAAVQEEPGEAESAGFAAEK